MKTPFTIKGLSAQISLPNWQSFVDAGSNDCHDPWNGHYPRASRGDDHYGYKDWPQAIAIATTGDHTLTAKILQIGDQLPKATAHLTRRRPTPALAGHTPIVGAYLSGEPRNMLRFTPYPARPIIRIGVNTAVSCGVERSTIETRGAAIMALTNALEAASYAVEIDLLEHWEEPEGGKFTATVNMKSAANYLDPGILAVAMLTQVPTRRLTFSLMEQLPDNIRKALSVPGHYAYPKDHPNSADYDLAIPAANYGQREWQSMENAADWCRNWLDKITQGKE